MDSARSNEAAGPEVERSRVLVPVTVDTYDLVLLGRSRAMDHVSARVLDHARAAGVTTDQIVSKERGFGGIVVEVYGTRPEVEGWDADGAPTAEWPVPAIVLRGSR